MDMSVRVATNRAGQMVVDIVGMAGCVTVFSATTTFPLSQLRSRQDNPRLVPVALKTSNHCSIRLVRPPCQVYHGFSSGKIVSHRTASDYADDDIHSLLQILPHDVCDNLLCDSKRDQLLEVTLDLGRLPQACYFGDSGRRYLRKTEVSMEELEYAQIALGELGGDNRAGIAGTLHRISAIRNKNGKVVGLTCRVGRPMREKIDMIGDLLEYGKSILFLGSKAIFQMCVKQIIVDTSNEIGGDGDIPHPAIGRARRLQVPEPFMQHKVMIEAVENHMPEVIIVDEIGTEAEVHACRTIAQRGVMLIGSAHGKTLENVIKNPILSDLSAAKTDVKIGGLKTVILSDQEASTRNCQKSILQRRAAPTFPFLIEMRERHYWVAHRTDKSVDKVLHGEKPLVEVRRKDKQFKVVIERWKTED
ncbi:hypothetical protein DH2020_049525 [Rehmannia glutinosa]|uniref:Stage III sporulation protein AA AAA+ ATPase domain-containing protein n=1 Tax=Rehmannia glutinosa TaxID=99300 RepID=A0ABR0U2I7_REHGL